MKPPVIHYMLLVLVLQRDHIVHLHDGSCITWNILFVIYLLHFVQQKSAMSCPCMGCLCILCIHPFRFVQNKYCKYFFMFLGEGLSTLANFLLYLTSRYLFQIKTFTHLFTPPFPLFKIYLVLTVVLRLVANDKWKSFPLGTNWLTQCNLPMFCDMESMWKIH
jgi:hypothetical protein